MTHGAARRKISTLNAPPRGAKGVTHIFYEFFAGGGMARAGLGDAWECRFANDHDLKKAATYAVNWGQDHLRVGDVADLRIADMPGRADLVWASFPCQDLSLAGTKLGLEGKRSGTFWPFWKLMTRLGRDGRAPRLIVLENVCGALSSHAGRDFAAISAALARGGYRFGAVIIDAAQFVPQSRPRLFIIAAHAAISVPPGLIADASDPRWHQPALLKAYANLSPRVRQAWVWWRLSALPARTIVLADIIEERPIGVDWHSSATTRRLLAMMSGAHRAKVVAAKKTGRRTAGCLYRRTRPDRYGRKVQRAEVRFDGLAGCLRTPAGGSSRQILLFVDGDNVRSRLISPRETARLMGLPDDYKLPRNTNDAFHLTGDGVVVPVVRYLADRIFEPLLRQKHGSRRRSEDPESIGCRAAKRRARSKTHVEDNAFPQCALRNCTKAPPPG